MEKAKGNLKPNLFIIGAPKSGTTSLSDYLSLYKEVSFSILKEPFYWTKEIKNDYKIDTMDQYLELFHENESTKYLAEASTNTYIDISAIKRILSFNPKAKFILLLRNPIEALYALHMERVYSFEESEKDFLKIWQNIKEGKDREKAKYIRYYKYYEHILELKKVLNSSLKVYTTDDLKFHEKFCKEITNFLGIAYDSSFVLPRSNKAHKHRFNFLASFILNPPKMLAPLFLKIRLFLTKKRFPFIERVKSLLNKKINRTTLPEEIREEIKAFFLDDINKTSEILNRDLSIWLK